MTEKISSFEDNLMPRSTIKNCAKAMLKQDAPIQKDALLALTKGSTVFISYLTAHANDIAISRKRKTIMPADVFEALTAIEFGRFVEDLRREHEENDQARKQKRSMKKTEDQGEQGLSVMEPSQMPSSKRVKVDGAQVEPEDSMIESDAEDAEEEAEVEDAEEDAAEEESVGEIDDTADIETVPTGPSYDAVDGDTTGAMHKVDYDEVLDDGDESD